jgi:hypothetical protein
MSVGEASRREFTLRKPREKHESVVKRLFCTSCCSMQDAQKVGRSAEYTLACGHARILMSSERKMEIN